MGLQSWLLVSWGLRKARDAGFWGHEPQGSPCLRLAVPRDVCGGAPESPLSQTSHLIREQKAFLSEKS